MIVLREMPPGEKVRKDQQADHAYQKSKPFGGGRPHFPLYTSTACLIVLLCLAIRSLHLTSPSRKRPSIGCVNPIDALEEFLGVSSSSSHSETVSFAPSGNRDLTNPGETSSRMRESTLAFSAAESASKGERKRQSPSSSYSAGRSGASGLKMGGSHFEGEKYEASGS